MVLKNKLAILVFSWLLLALPAKAGERYDTNQNVLYCQEAVDQYSQPVYICGKANTYYVDDPTIVNVAVEVPATTYQQLPSNGYYYDSSYYNQPSVSYGFGVSLRGSTFYYSNTQRNFTTNRTINRGSYNNNSYHRPWGNGRQYNHGNHGYKRH